MRPVSLHSITFPYKVYKAIPCPIITVELKGSRGWVGLDAYVDSGAFYSIFSTQDAEFIGIDYRTGKRGGVTVGDSGVIPVFFHVLPVRVGPHELNATIGFSPRLGVGFNLLGQGLQDVLDPYRKTRR